MRSRRHGIAAGCAALVVAGCQPSVFEVNIGDCLNLPADTVELSTVEVVDCAEPHSAEVYALPQLPADDSAVYPGDQEVAQQGRDRCLEEFEEYVGTDYASSSLIGTVVTPSEQSWDAAGDREIVCLVTGLDGAQLTGSKRGSGE